MSAALGLFMDREDRERLALYMGAERVEESASMSACDPDACDGGAYPCAYCEARELLLIADYDDAPWACRGCGGAVDRPNASCGCAMA